jgi:hypothetical protein
MWLGHTSSWWGLVISIACLFLTVPLAIGGNLLTPKVRAWWAVRSLGSGTQRLNGLVEIMKRMQTEPELNPSATAILLALKGVSWSLFMTIYTILLAIVYGVGSDLTVRPPRLRPGYLKLFIGVAFIQVCANVYGQVKIQQGLRNSAAERKRLNDEFEHAKKKLQLMIDKTEKAKALGKLD